MREQLGHVATSSPAANSSYTVEWYLFVKLFITDEMTQRGYVRTLEI